MEIGSEFWLENQIFLKEKIKNDNNNMFFLSGRTAIDYVIDILEQKKTIQKVYFPSYCCSSMLQPFLERNIKIDFYKVSFNNGKITYDIDCNKECDVFFAMNYFGFNKYNMDFYIDKFKEKKKIIIEDSTHSWLSKRKYNKNSDFVIASLRKWFPIISGAILINESCDWKLDTINLNDNKKYVLLKEEAMIEKNKYINNNQDVDKDKMLKKYYEANEVLEKDYKRYKIDEKSYNILNNLDMEEIIKKRRENVRTIYEFLTKQKEIGYLKEINLEEDCPIFVPIFLENKSEIKNYLIKNKVYCPNHWNIPEQIGKIDEKDIYEKELSLVCDQRYEKKDITGYINLIKNKGE